MNETKMLSFDEWWERNCLNVSSNRYDFLKLFQDARIGTIPADRAVEIPEVWPERNVDGSLVHGCAVVFTICLDEEDFFDMWWNCAVKFIPRPKSAWNPKSGEPCLLNVEGIAVEIVYSDAYTHLKRENMAQRDPAKIGKPWSEL